MITISIPKETIDHLVSEPDFVELNICGTNVKAIYVRSDKTFFAVDVCYCHKEVFAHESGEDISERYYEQ